MPTEQPNLFLPRAEDMIPILDSPAAPGLLPIGDCGEGEFRQLLATSPGLPVSPAMRLLLIQNPPAEFRSRFPALVEMLRQERHHLRRELPELLATLAGELGRAYCLLRGHRGQNLQSAIACFQLSLDLLTEDRHPNLWAMAQNNLGCAYLDLPTEDRGENLRRVIACFEAALRVFTETAFPKDWAMTQNNLGIAYRRLPTGDRGENLRRAIAHLEAASRVRTEADSPLDWAATQNNLGNAYAELPAGDRGANLRRAIACYEAALRVCTEKDFPADWAMTQNNLGNTYRDLPTGDRGGNLRRAIACYEAALRVYTQADFPTLWAATQNNLGNTYRDLPTGDRGDNLRRAITCYEAALCVCTQADFSHQWAITQSNLGNAYRDLPTGDRVENLRRAVACYDATLGLLTEADSPLDWARTQSDLGNACLDLPTGDRAGNLRRAIACFEAALRVYSEDGFPSHWAATQYHLGSACLDLPTGDRAGNLRRAIAYFEAALRVLTEVCFPLDWAAIQNSLGNAYTELSTGDRGENLRRAIACFEATLRVLTGNDFPAQWATIQNNLGNAYCDLPTGDRGDNLRRAVACYEAAYHGFARTGDEEKLQLVSHRIGQVLDYELGNMTAALEAYRRSIKHFDRIRAELVGREYKEVFQERQMAVLPRAVRALLTVAEQAVPGRQQSRLWAEAFETSDRARCRILHEMVDRDNGVRPAGNKDLAGFVSLERLVEEVLDPGTAFLEYGTLSDGRFVLFAAAQGRGILVEPAVLDSEPAGDALQRLVDLQLALSQGQSGLQARDIPAFLNHSRPKFDARLVALREAILPDPVLEAIRQAGVHRLVVVPDHFLHWVPFHALAWRDGRTRYLADEFAVSYAPQAGVYARVRELARPRGHGPALIMCGPHAARQPELLSSDEEFYAAVEPFPDDIRAELGRLAGPRGTFLERATPQDFRHAAPHAGLAHFFGHGTFGFRRQEAHAADCAPDVQQGGEAKLYFWDRPLSSLELHGWDRDFLLDRCAVLTLAACSVGQVDFLSKEAAREVLGLTAALLERQVPALVSALWPARVDAALTFFARFYAHFAPEMGIGKSRLDAFTAAQRDLRGDPIFSHPYLWAPFYLMGADN